VAGAQEGENEEEDAFENEKACDRRSYSKLVSGGRGIDQGHALFCPMRMNTLAFQVAKESVKIARRVRRAAHSSVT